MGRAVKEPTLELLVEDARLLVRVLADPQQCTAEWRKGRKSMGCGNEGSQHRDEAGLDGGCVWAWFRSFR